MTLGGREHTGPHHWALHC